MKNGNPKLFIISSIILYEIKLRRKIMILTKTSIIHTGNQTSWFLSIFTFREARVPMGAGTFGSGLTASASVLLNAGGKPSTWFPPGGLVVLGDFSHSSYFYSKNHIITPRDTYRSIPEPFWILTRISQIFIIFWPHHQKSIRKSKRHFIDHSPWNLAQKKHNDTN